MGSCFGCRSATGADNANVTMPLHETDEQQPSGTVVTDDKLALLSFRVVRVRENTGKRIREHSDCVVESNTVLASVGCGLALIPFELHAQQFSRALGAASNA